MKLTVWLPWLFCQVLENLKGFGQSPPLTPISFPVLLPSKIALEYLIVLRTEFNQKTSRATVSLVQ